MKSIILLTATRYLLPLLLVFSIFVLQRGHHEPGGGFVGGLVAASAFILYSLAYGVPAARSILKVEPRILMGVGLLLAVAAGVIGLLSGRPFLSAVWLDTVVPAIGHLELGTPLLFDVGVYLVVLGVALTIIFTLVEE